jgi:hypothetical protein
MTAEAAAAAAALAAVAAEDEDDDVKQPLAALAAAAGLELAPSRSAAAIAAAAAAKKHVGPVPGSEVLQAVKQYTGSTKQVQAKVKAALQQVRLPLFCQQVLLQRCCKHACAVHAIPAYNSSAGAYCFTAYAPAICTVSAIRLICCCTTSSWCICCEAVRTRMKSPRHMRHALLLCCTPCVVSRTTSSFNQESWKLCP